MKLSLMKLTVFHLHSINDVSSRYRGGMPYIYISFTRNGIPYSAQVLLGDKLPKTLNAYYNAVNRIASQNISQTSNKLKKYLDNFENIRLNKSDINDDFIFNKRRRLLLYGQQ